MQDELGSVKSIFQCPRRDMCHNVGVRASMLSPDESALAWQSLARQLEAMGDLDIPKFKDLLCAIRAANITARHANIINSNTTTNNPQPQGRIQPAKVQPRA